MEKVSRKAFLKRTGLLGLGLMAGMSGLSSCGGGEQERQTTTPAAKPSGRPPSVPEVDCSKYNENLPEAAQELRKNLGYVSETSKPNQYCKNCQFWQPDKYPDACGGCQLFPDGAVNPAGWCASWTVAPAGV